MILDTYLNHKKYLSLHKNFPLAFEFIEQYVLNPKPVGKYEISGEKVFALVQEYEPKIESKFESHKEYIDIQFVVSGNEKMEIADTEKCKVQEDLTPGKDMIFYENNMENISTLVLGKNDFVIFFPNDAHKPALKYDSKFVNKIVVKVRID